MRSLLIIIAIALVSMLFSVPANAAYTDQTNAHLGEVPGYSDPDYRLGRKNRPATMVIGDSITYGGYVSALRSKRPGWEVSARPGRNVSTLPYYVKDRMVNGRKPPKVLVIALSTNASVGWTYNNLKSVVNMVPKRTKVVFVNTYRDPAKFHNGVNYRERASVQAMYSRWMDIISNTRARTCVADWRAAVTARPWLVHDGVHPVPGYGYSVWYQVLTKAISNCS